jgi:amidase
MPLPPPSPDELRRLADELHLPLDREHAELFGELIGGFLAGFELIDALPEPAAPEHPGRSWQRPSAAENPLGAWAARTQIRERENGALAGRTVAVKDNIALAGVPMTGGASFLGGFVPQEDATVVRRVLEAGAEIVGKAACEYLSASGGSHTSCSGVVRNPHDTTRSTGGSSSGCGALVAAGEVDLAIGGDQGGSIRFPASYTSRRLRGGPRHGRRRPDGGPARGGLRHARGRPGGGRRRPRGR